MSFNAIDYILYNYTFECVKKITCAIYDFDECDFYNFVTQRDFDEKGLGFNENL